MSEITRIATVKISSVIKERESSDLIKRADARRSLEDALHECIIADNIIVTDVQDFVFEGDIEEFKSVQDREDYFREHFTRILGESLVGKMIELGFCSAPASRSYHGDYEGGLFDHSLAVTNCLVKYTRCLGLGWERVNSPIIVGMLHDLCKIDSYKKVVTRKETDHCFEEYHYEHSNDAIIQGHGDKSVIYAMQLGIELTEEEIACISYHMGAYETDRWSAYDRAIKRYPNVLFTHTADMEASKIVGV